MEVKAVYSVKEVAEILKTSQPQVRKMISDELLPAVMVGREYRIYEEDLLAFLKSAGTAE